MAFQKCIIFHFSDKFLLYNWIFDKKFNFFADAKSRAQELSYDVSFLIFGHQTWDLEGGVKYPRFQVPQQR